MASQNNRRKSKLTHINNECFNEEPVYEIDLTNSSVKKNTPRKKGNSAGIVALISSEDENLQPNEPKKHRRSKKRNKLLPSSPEDTQQTPSTKIKAVNSVKNEGNEDLMSLNSPELKVVLKDIVKASKRTTNNLPVQAKEKSAVDAAIQQTIPPKTPNKNTPKRAGKKLVELQADQINEGQKTPRKQTVSNGEAENISPPVSGRRSLRKKKMSLKALEALDVVKSPEKRWRKVIDSDSSPENEPSKTLPKSTILFENEDVAGSNIYGFQTPKKRDGLFNKVAEVLDSPAYRERIGSAKKLHSTPSSKRTPAKNSIAGIQIPKTPAALRIRVKKNLAHFVREMEGSDFEDHSPCGSEYDPSDSSSTSVEDYSESAIVEAKSPNTPVKKPSPKGAKEKRRTRASTKDPTYNLHADDYFTLHANAKSVTSDHTLDRLKNPRFSQDKLNELLQNMKIPPEHEKAISNLSIEYRGLFQQWLYLLHQGFSILLYGLGSKRNLLEDFHREMSRHNDYPVIVINGFFPSLVIEDVVDAVAYDLLELEDTPTNIYDIVERIKADLNANSSHLFLIVHNIEGEMLRNAKSQNILSKLAAIPNVHLLASVDHINAPLNWDHSKLGRFNFTWWDCTTYLPYIDETSFEGSMLVQRSGALTLSSLKNIFQSLTTNARGIYSILIKNQIKHKKDAHYEGISFKDLYWQCREAFLVSSDVALRAQLTEFLDHKLVKSKRSIDGAELMVIPIETALLKHFLDNE